MSTPTDTPIEDRLRAHFADLARTTNVPGPEADTTLARAREAQPVPGGAADGLARRRLSWSRPLLAVAAAVVVIALVAGVALARRDDPAGVSTDPTPPPPTPTTDPPRPTTTVTEPDPTTTSTPPLAPVTTIVVGISGILGGWDGTAWEPWDPDESAPAGLGYQRVQVDEGVTTVEGTPAQYRCVERPVPNVDVGLSGSLVTLGPVGVGVHGVPDVQPRAVEVLGESADSYRPAAIEVGIGLGVAQPDPQVVQAVRSDLDGDGSDEVIVVAEQMQQPGSASGAPGDWSAVFVRQVVGGGVRTTVLSSYVVPPGDAHFHYILVHRVGAVADLNGDGRMEIVTNHIYYEGGSTVVDELGADGAITTVLSSGCGL